MKRVIVDIYGADAGHDPVIKGSLRALSDFSDLSLVLVGDPEDIKRAAESVDYDAARTEIVPSDDVITNHDQPSEVFSGRNTSSMVLALERLKSDNDCIGLISAGNTGSLLVGSIFRLGLIKGLKMPALGSLIPIADGKNVLIADCGANLDCTAKQLEEFAVMGNAFFSCVEGVKDPKVGLLSVGREDEKGNRLTKEAFGLISGLGLNFIGNIEGTDPVTGEADVIVTDGFAGNILLKNTEAVGKSAIAAVEEAMAKASDYECRALAEVRDRLKNAFDFNPRGGGTFLGTKKPVVKMHGALNESTARSCIGQIMRLADTGFTERISEALARIKQTEQ